MQKQDKALSVNNIVGCFGKIVKFEETEQNTYLISLKGLSRFKIISSSFVERGYMNSNISTKDFQNDFNQFNKNESFKFADDRQLKMSLKTYLKFKKLDSNWNYINSCSNINLINQLSMICPFSVHEKQMLLESSSIDERYILLVSILQNTVNLNEEKNKLNTNSEDNINRLLEILVCPKTGGKLTYDKKKSELISLRANLAYPIRK